MEGGPSIQENENLNSESYAENESGCAYSCCHPRGKMHRFIALLFMCFLGFGSYFCYDNPAALQDNFEKDLNITVSQFVVFYSVYSFPNMILCFVGGFLIDRVFGIRLGTNIYMALTLLGQVFFAGGAILNMFWLMIVGRFIFGIGAESLAVAQNNYAVLWFKGKELNMVFGLQLSFARFGSTVNFWVMEPIYKWVNQAYTGYEGLGIVLFIATATCLISMICSIVLGCLDKRAEAIMRRNDNAAGELVQLRDIGGFGLSFWLITAICVSYYVAIFPFIGLGKKFFIVKFHLDPQQANFVNSLVYLISAFASPLLGFLVDKSGKNIFWILGSILATIGAHSILAFTLLNPYIGMVMMGIAYSMLASGLWPLVSLIIPENQLGTAYGVCQAIQNTGLTIITYLTGTIVENGGYFWLEVFFLGNLSVAFVMALLLWLVDAVKKGALNMTPGERERRQQSILASEVLEREQLLSAGSNSVQPSDHDIRIRYLSRVGAQLPEHYVPHMKGFVFRAL